MCSSDIFRKVEFLGVGDVHMDAIEDTGSPGTRLMKRGFTGPGHSAGGTRRVLTLPQAKELADFVHVHVPESIVCLEKTEWKITASRIGCFPHGQTKKSNVGGERLRGSTFRAAVNRHVGDIVGPCLSKGRANNDGIDMI